MEPTSPVRPEQAEILPLLEKALRDLAAITIEESPPDTCGGIGFDLLDIQRFSDMLRAHPRVLNRLFAQAELTGARREPDFECGLALRFAAKEAVLKASGEGWPGKLRFNDIVLRDVMKQSQVIVVRHNADALTSAHFAVACRQVDGIAAAVAIAKI